MRNFPQIGKYLHHFYIHLICALMVWTGVVGNVLSCSTSIYSKKIHTKINYPGKSRSRKGERTNPDATPAASVRGQNPQMQAIAQSYIKITADKDSIAFSTLRRDLKFSGFEKRSFSKKETFLTTNNSDFTVTGFEIDILYTDLENRMLHRCSRTIDILLPPGETRIIEIPSIDTQSSMYYYLSTPPRKGGMPFKIKITLLSVDIENECESEDYSPLQEDNDVLMESK